jgi:hypothetical protein
MKNSVFWDINTQFLPHRRHVTSLLQNPACFHGCNYEEYLLLGYKNPVLASHETQYSATESSQLILCKICVFHGYDYEE